MVEEERLPQVEERLKVISHLRTPAGIRARFLSPDPVSELAAEPVEPTLEDAYIYLLGREAV